MTHPALIALAFLRTQPRGSLAGDQVLALVEHVRDVALAEPAHPYRAPAVRPVSWGDATEGSTHVGYGVGMINTVTTPLPAADGEVGASRIFELDIQPSPKALPAPLYVDGRVDVAIQNEPTMGARMNPNVKPFRDTFLAAAAFL